MKSSRRSIDASRGCQGSQPDQHPKPAHSQHCGASALQQSKQKPCEAHPPKSRRGSLCGAFCLQLIAHSAYPFCCLTGRPHSLHILYNPHAATEQLSTIIPSSIISSNSLTLTRRTTRSLSSTSGISLTHRQPLCEKDMVLLIHHPIRDLQRRKMRHPLSRQPSLFLQLTSRHLLRHNIRRLPPTLRKLHEPPTHRVANCSIK